MTNVIYWICTNYRLLVLLQLRTADTHFKQSKFLIRSCTKETQQQHSSSFLKPGVTLHHMRREWRALKQGLIQIPSDYGVDILTRLWHVKWFIISTTCITKTILCNRMWPLNHYVLHWDFPRVVKISSKFHEVESSELL